MATHVHPRRHVLGFIGASAFLAVASRFAPPAAANQQGSTVNDVNAYIGFCRSSGASIDVSQSTYPLTGVTMVKCRFGGKTTLTCAWEDGVPRSKVCVFTELSAQHSDLAAIDFTAANVADFAELLPSDLLRPAPEPTRSSDPRKRRTRRK